MPLLRLVPVKTGREWPLLRGKHGWLEVQDRDQLDVVECNNAIHTISSRTEACSRTEQDRGMFKPRFGRPFWWHPPSAVRSIGRPLRHADGIATIPSAGQDVVDARGGALDPEG